MDYKYAGVENSGECYCGNEIQNNPKTSTGCNYPCPGNQDEMCGGNDAINIV